MRYEINVAKRFERDFRRLTKEIKIRINSAIWVFKRIPILASFFAEIRAAVSWEGLGLP